MKARFTIEVELDRLAYQKQYRDTKDGEIASDLGKCAVMGLREQERTWPSGMKAIRIVEAVDIEEAS